MEVGATVSLKIRNQEKIKRREQQTAATKFHGRKNKLVRLFGCRVRDMPKEVKGLNLQLGWSWGGGLRERTFELAGSDIGTVRDYIVSGCAWDGLASLTVHTPAVSCGVVALLCSVATFSDAFRDEYATLGVHPVHLFRQPPLFITVSFLWGWTSCN